MKIITRTDIPDSTYFTATDVEPYMNENALVIFDGKGTRRGWGAPSVTSTVVINTATFTVVHVGFSHKHRGGQGWYYLINGERKTWAQLSDKRQRQVMTDVNAPRAIRKAPSWAKTPGVLRKDRKTPEATKKTAYKLVKVEGERLLSLYDGETEYQIGKRLAEKAQDDHQGGYYAYPTAEGCKALWEAGKLVPVSRAEGVSRLALLEVEISGTVVEYGTKLAATYIKPVKVIEIIEVA